ncbi:MAG: hypothetical protein AB2L14_02405 [Candidatus Xenobiia bacterium LiM19]
MKNTIKQRRSSGVVILTALFLVLIIFALVVVIVSMVSQNISFTKYSHMKTKAYYLAKGGVNLALKAMIEDPDSKWDTNYTQSSPYESIEGKDKIQAWASVSTTSADVLFLHGRGIINYASPARIAQDFVVVLKKASTMPVTYARRNTWGPDAIYRSEGGGSWELITDVPPRIFWNNSFDRKDKTGEVDPTKSGNVYKVVNTLRSLCSDNKGNLYGVWVRGGPNTLYRYNQNDGWKAIKPPKHIFYTTKGERKEQSRPVPNLDELATDGENYLFARYSNPGAALRPDTIYRLDLNSMDTENPTWNVLPPAPKRYYKNVEGAPLVEPDGYAWNLSSLSCDKTGNLYARFNRYGIDTVYRFPDGGLDSKEVSEKTWEPNDWQYLPAVPRVYYALKDEKYVEVDPVYSDGEPRYAGNIQNLAVTSDGTLYGRYNCLGADTLYRLEVGQKTADEIKAMKTEDWKTVKPTARTYYNDPTEEEVEGEDEDDIEEAIEEEGDLTVKEKMNYTHIKETAMNSDDALYMLLPVGWHPDSILKYDSKSYKPGVDPEYKILRPIPAYRYRWLRNPDYPKEESKWKYQWTALERKVKGKLQKVREQAIDELTAGGIISDTGKSIYVVVSNL